MTEKNFLLLKVCDQIVNYSIFVLAFFVPILFLPWTSDVLDFNKQACILLFSFIALCAWMIRTVVSGQFQFNVSKMHIFAGVWFVIYILASIFSINRYASFWGANQSLAESMFTCISLVWVYLLASNILPRKSITISLLILLASGFIAQIIGIFQLSGISLPFAFAQSPSFNTIGSAGALGFFSAILIPISIAFLIIAKKWKKSFFVVQILTSFVVLCLINYTNVWWALAVGSIAMVILAIIKRDVVDGRWMALPMFFFTVSLFFILLHPQISWLPQKSNEIYLSWQESYSIDMQSLKTRPLLGSGPGTFSYNFLKFKNPSLSNSPFWNVVFGQGVSEASDSLADMGVLGFLALLIFIIAPIVYAIKFLLDQKLPASMAIADKKSQKDNFILILGLSSALCVQIFAYIFYSINITLSFTAILFIALMVGLVSQEKKQYQLKPSSVLTLVTTCIFTLVFIFGLGLVIFEGQRYVAEVDYNNGLSLWQAKQYDSATASVESAASLNTSSDVYFSQLSQMYLSSLQTEISNLKAAPTDVEKQKIQTLAANAVNSAKISTDINPSNASDWSNRGYIYQSLLGLVADADKFSKTSYDQALALDPTNPYLYMQEGGLSYISAMQLTKDQATQKTQLLSDAQTKLEKSVALNQNYFASRYTLGLIYDAEGQNDKSVEQFKIAQQLDPQDTSIQTILDNIGKGLPALQPVAPPSTTPTTTVVPQTSK